jgi:hypothetical protein
MCVSAARYSVSGLRSGKVTPTRWGVFHCSHQVPARHSVEQGGGYEVMAGAMKKVGVYLGLLEDTDDYDDNGALIDDDPAPVPHGSTRADRATTVASLAEHRRPTSVSSQGSNSQASGSMVTELSRITTLHPRTYNEARTIGEHFREGIPVIMNLSLLPVARSSESPARYSSCRHPTSRLLPKTSSSSPRAASSTRVELCVRWLRRAR